MDIKTSKLKVVTLVFLVNVLILSIYKDGTYLTKGASLLGVYLESPKGISDTMVTHNNISDTNSVTNKTPSINVTTTSVTKITPKNLSASTPTNTPSLLPSLTISPTPLNFPTSSLTKTPNITPNVTLTKTPSPTLNLSKTPTPTPIPQNISPLSVVINEIAWMGTSSSYTDEWIELYNNTDTVISLEGWVLKSLTDDSPEIILSGSINGHGYYLIERTNDSVISNVLADMVSSFGKGGLNNSGEVLTLLDASGKEHDKTSFGNDAWIAGDNVTKSTMARIDSVSPGDLISNWATHGESVGNEIDAGGVVINGSPKRPNTIQ